MPSFRRIAKRLFKLVLKKLFAPLAHGAQDHPPKPSQEAPPDFPVGQTFRGRVIKVTDGDTAVIKLANQTTVRVRFFGIDAPEKAQLFGPEAQEYLATLILNKAVTVHVRDRDRYQRTVGEVILNRASVNAMMIDAGYAWHYATYTKRHPEKAQDFEDREQEARRRKVGLWKKRNPTPPWEFRKQKRGG